MGNHDNKGIDQDYFDTVSDLIPADAQHMSGSKYKNYALVRENVLFINISYEWLPFAYDFVAGQIARHRDEADHIILMTHNSLVGNRYRSEEHTSELQSLMRISYDVFCLKKKKNIHTDALHM